jgi:coproporphyrinogen III oxidase
VIAASIAISLRQPRPSYVFTSRFAAVGASLTLHPSAAYHSAAHRIFRLAYLTKNGHHSILRFKTCRPGSEIYCVAGPLVIIALWHLD